MEEKAEYILKIITEDGDSFRTRAEQYYRKRPEIVNFVEDTFREYRALAERYDHLSKDLQSANRTIAMFFPERVQMSIDDEDYEEFTSSFEENDQNKNPSSSPVPLPLPLPEAPAAPKIENIVQAMIKKNSKMPTKMMSKRGLIKMGVDENASGVSISSGLSKDEALDEIDKLQKDILGLQTEKEFVKSSYENALSKYWEIENNITEIHARICSLQDEFGVGAVIEETDAQTLMSSSALKTCEETLEKLKNKQQRFKKEATVEHKRVDDIRKKFEALIASNKDSNPDSKNLEQTKEHVKDKKAKIEEKQQTIDGNMENSDQEVILDSETVYKSEPKEGELSIEDKKARIKEEILGKNGPITISEVAEKIEQLVDKVFDLETEVTSQAALVMRLRLENDELHERVQKLEEEKQILEDDSNNMKIKIKRLEEELKRLQNLDQKVKGQNVRLETSFDEASVDLDYLSKELLTAKPDEKTPDDHLIIYPKVEEDENGSGFEKDHDHDHDLDEKDKKWREVNDEDAHWIKGCKENPNENEKDEDGEQDKTMEGRKDREWTKMVFKKEQDDDDDINGKEDDQPNWNLIFSYGVEDREKMLLEEYTTTLRNLKQVKKKLNEIEKRNRANTFRSAVQMKVLRTANHSKDAQIKALFEKLKLFERNMNQTNQQKKYPDSVDEGIETRIGHERNKGPNSVDDQGIEERRKGLDEIELKKASDSVDEGIGRRKGLDESVEYFELKEPPDQDLVDEGNESRKGIDESVEFFEPSYDDSIDEGTETRKGIEESVEFFEADPDDSVVEGTNRRKELDGIVDSVDEEEQRSRKEPEEITSSKDQDSVHEITQKSKELDQETTKNLELKKDHQDSVQEGSQRSSKDQVDDDADEPHEVSDIEDEIRKEIEELRKENLELWLRFSTTYHQINRFQDSYHDLLQDIKEARVKKPDGSGKQRHHHQHHSRSTFTSDIRPLYRHLLEMQTELTLWLESSEILEDDLQHRLASLSDIQDELLNLKKEGSKAEKMHDYETAKFQGEVSNMKQENVKILEELQAAAERVKKLLVDMEKTLAMLDEELGENKKKTSRSSSRIPLKSFLFGVKLRKRKSSLLNCMSPSLKRRYSKLQEQAPAQAPATEPATATATATAPLDR
ncbi:KIP1-like protein [Cynara cardunculus var. scolymus]|uniref:KIP1-like protein n=2 Tax=Cynara cardunculus var. scolymus TaxID=59895 RepID=A0A103XBV0_CYNCS|nr:KIP1-like protein [Cynara cardunculus var. scolymus]